MLLEIETKPVNTLKAIKEDTKNIKNSICEHLGLNRAQFKLSNGLITLRGYSEEFKSWYNLTSTIGNFPEYLKSESYSKYKLYCHVELKTK